MSTIENVLTNVTADHANDCSAEAETVHFHVANVCILLAFAAPNTSYGQVRRNWLLFHRVII